MHKPLDHLTLLKAVRELAGSDEDLSRIASMYGPPPLWEREQGFPTLIHIILEQQVSLASAKAAYNRLEEAVNPLTPEGFLGLSDEELRRIGFSRQETRHGREGLTRFAHLIRTYFRLGGHHVQFNVVSADTLRAAQEHPEQYRNLVVRVAGYSDYFVRLSRDLQDEIISRTEQGLQ